MLAGWGPAIYVPVITGLRTVSGNFSSTMFQRGKKQRGNAQALHHRQDVLRQPLLAPPRGQNAGAANLPPEIRGLASCRHASDARLVPARLCLPSHARRTTQGLI